MALASLVFWRLIAGLSVMAFDSGVTAEAGASVIAVWIAYARRKDRLAGVLTTLTFLPVLVLIVILALSSFLFSMGL